MFCRYVFLSKTHRTQFLLHLRVSQNSKRVRTLVTNVTIVRFIVSFTQLFNRESYVYWTVYHLDS